MPIFASTPDPTIAPEARAAADRYIAAVRSMQDCSYWPVRMFAAVNLFLWHLDAFEQDGDPIAKFVAQVGQAAGMLESIVNNGVCGEHFPSHAVDAGSGEKFESKISGLYGDIWVDMTDDIYFDEAYEFIKQRFEKNGVDPQAYFAGKAVLDAGCGSGKFGAAIARFGAAKVVGVDIGEKGLAFAERQKAKVDYGARMEFHHTSIDDLPFDDGSFDIVWCNGVLHHTVNYEGSLSEISRVTRPGGSLYLNVEGFNGLFGLLSDMMVDTNQDIPRPLFQHYLATLAMNSGRMYWIMDALYAPYEKKSSAEVEGLLDKYGYADPVRMMRGTDKDITEKIAAGTPHAAVKYGEASLKYIATKV